MAVGVGGWDQAYPDPVVCALASDGYVFCNSPNVTAQFTATGNQYSQLSVVSGTQFCALSYNLGVDCVIPQCAFDNLNVRVCNPKPGVSVTMGEVTLYQSPINGYYTAGTSLRACPIGTFGDASPQPFITPSCKGLLAPGMSVFFGWTASEWVDDS